MGIVKTLVVISVLAASGCTEATFLSDAGGDTPGAEVVVDVLIPLSDLPLAEFPVVDTGPDISADTPGDSADADGAVVDECGAEPFEFLCPCEFNSQCESGFCIAVTDDVVDQRCTRECDANCPEGYECKEVAGAGDPIFICVQVIDKLCDPCFSNADCLVPGDLCLQVESATYCARDCSAATCPEGYSCTTIADADGAGESMQCLPNSGSCACPPGVDLQNDPDHCGECGNECAFDNAVAGCSGGDCVLSECKLGFYDIDGNPANGCEYECNKTSETDAPDPQQVDENCDGIDGDIQRAVFVSPSGKDTNSGTKDKPVKTITAGIGKTGGASGVDHVYIAAGAYAERVVLADGISLFGAFSADGKWTRSLAAYETIIQSDVPDTDGSIRAVIGDGLTLPMTVAALTVQAANNPTTGGSSYALWLNASGGAVALRDCRFVAGNGGPGSSAQNQPKAADGAKGQPGKSTDDTDCNCNEFETYGGHGGAPGTATCNGAGAGGMGADSSCGNDSGKVGAASPDGTPGGPVEDDGDDGQDGVTGSHGSGGAGGELVGGLWTGHNGQPGQSGTNGTGGGGGGSGDGHPNGLFGCAVWGGGGGGGASAGCGGAGAGAGSAGGGSFGLFLIDSSPDIRDCEVSQKNGGNGGNGGVGGAPGLGRTGGAGGTGHEGGGDGGKGGDSGDGGAGGNGGGGAGGPSFGIALFGTSSPKCVGNTFLPLGVGGIGGIGGNLQGNAGAQGEYGVLNGSATAACDPNNQ